MKKGDLPLEDLAKIILIAALVVIFLIVIGNLDRFREGILNLL